jgi:uncharacterized iron-regulated protein
MILILTSSITGIHRKIIRLRDGEHTSFMNMMDEISSARAIYIGESHENVAHHQTQLDVIRSLHEKKDLPMAIGLEMIKKEDQASLDAWISGKMKEEDFIPIFLRNWGFNWLFYREIFIYAREHEIPLVALNVPKNITKKVGEQGFASLTDEELAQLPPGVTCELNQQYMDHLAEIFQYKGKRDRSFEYFCEAQVLWDQSMAWYLAQYMKNNSDRTIVVLAGSIHAWKYGIPQQKKKYISIEQKIIVPDLPVEHGTIGEDDADYLVVHG